MQKNAQTRRQLKEISLGFSLEEMMLKLQPSTLGQILWEELTYWRRFWTVGSGFFVKWENRSGTTEGRWADTMTLLDVEEP